MFLTRSPLGLPVQAPWTSFDLHVLSTPPAFVLSQDQTLRQELAACATRSGKSVGPGGNNPEVPISDFVLFLFGPDGISDPELTSSFHDLERPLCCPHWRSVFSSVFKELLLNDMYPQGAVMPIHHRTHDALWGRVAMLRAPKPFHNGRFRNFSGTPACGQLSRIRPGRRGGTRSCPCGPAPIDHAETLDWQGIPRPRGSVR